MPANDSPPKKLLDAGLKTLLATLDPPKWLKAPATFIAEPSGRLVDLPEEQKASVRDVSDRDLAGALLQLDLAARHAARAAAGAVRIEERVAALRAAVDEGGSPTIIKFPDISVTQDVAGHGNTVVGSGSVNIGKVDMRRTRKRSSTPVLPGTVATDPYKVGYERTPEGLTLGRSAVRKRPFAFGVRLSKDGYALRAQRADKVMAIA